MEVNKSCLEQEFNHMLQNKTYCNDEPENIVDNPDYHPGISINRQLLILRLIICTVVSLSLGHSDKMPPLFNKTYCNPQLEYELM
jgi:hypothetical protein